MRMSWLIGGLALTAVAVASCSDDGTTPPVRERYVVPLTGLAERPNPVTTTASGSALVTVISPDTIEYSTYVAADSVIAAHFHAGAETAAGPVMIFIFGGPVIGRVDGAFQFARITRQSTFVNNFTYDSLMTRIRAGTTYINVHTRKNPSGEIRGQVKK